MNDHSKSKTFVTILIGMLLLALPMGLSAQQTIDIQVSPNVLNHQNQGQVVTIHTDIPFSQVVATSVKLNGVEIDHWKSDSQGFFVAKFLMSEIKDLPLNIDDYNTMTLEGSKTDGTTFTGTDEILVINVAGSSRK